jgi:hypothetical protein
MSPAKYELGFYIPEVSILRSHRRENYKSYIMLAKFLTGTQDPSFSIASKYNETWNDSFLLGSCQRIMDRGKRQTQEKISMIC